MAEPGLKLHVESELLLDLRAKNPTAKKYYEYETVSEAREANNNLFGAFQGDFSFRGSTKEIFIPSQDVKDGIPVDIYMPENISSNPPILIYFHGGGLVLGSRRNTTSACKQLASGACCIVVNVEYRLAPENKFPAMMDDACCVVNYILKNKENVGGGQDSKVGVAGDSGGGNIAASVCHDCKGINFQVLIYPHVSARGDYSLPSYEDFREGPIIDRTVIDWFINLMASKEDWTDPRLAPLLRKNFQGLPPALFVVAEYDPLRDDSYAYSKKLTDAGIHNEIYVSKGAVHAFYTLPGIFKELTSDAYEKTIDFIQRYGTA